MNAKTLAELPLFMQDKIIEHLIYSFADVADYVEYKWLSHDEKKIFNEEQYTQICWWLTAVMAARPELLR